jgi:DNA primase
MKWLGAGRFCFTEHNLTKGGRILNAIATDERVDFTTIKQSVPMEWLLDHYGLTPRLRRSTDGFRGVCPIHGGHNPTQFCVSVTRNCWVCFGDCNVGGSVLDFVSRMEKVSIREAGQLIQQWLGIQPLADESPRNKEVAHRLEVNDEVHKRAPNPPLRFTLRDLDAAHPYLALRRVLPETVATFGVGFCAKGLMAGRIAIPIHNADGQVVAYAGRWPGKPPDDRPKYMFPRGLRKSLEIFNYHRAVAADLLTALVVVEGFFDCMKVWQAGYQRVVSIMGSSLSDAQEDLIVKAVGRGGKVILMFDEDGAGRAGREKAAMRLARRVRVEVIELEIEGTQPDHLPSGEILGLLTDVRCAVKA